MKEIHLTEKAFKNILGEDYENKLIRFPGGSFGPNKAPFREKVTAADTDVGEELKKQIKDLKMLLLAYRKGLIKEKR